MKGETMKKSEIKKTIEELAKHQGFYGNIHRVITENPEVLQELENKHFNDVVDMVIYLES